MSRLGEGRPPSPVHAGFDRAPSASGHLQRKNERGWLSRSIGRVSDLAVFSWWVASGMPEQEQPQSVSGRRGRQKHIPTILARTRSDPDGTGHRTEAAGRGSSLAPSTPTSPNYLVSPKRGVAMSPKDVNRDGEMDIEEEVQAHIDWIKRYLEEVRLCEKVKAERARRIEAERVWREVEENETLRRKTRSFYDGDDSPERLPADDGADGGGKNKNAARSRRRPGVTRPKINRLRLADVQNSFDEDYESDAEGRAQGLSGVHENRAKEMNRAVRSHAAALQRDSQRHEANSADNEHDQIQASRPAAHVQSTSQGAVDTRTAAHAAAGGQKRAELSKEEVAAVFSKIRHRRYEAVMEIFKTGRMETETRDEFGNTLLMLAAQTGSKRMCKILLREGASLQAQNWRGQTVLHFCYAFKYSQLGDYLKTKGADDSILNHYHLDCYSGLEPASPQVRYDTRSVTFAADTKGPLPASGGGAHAVEGGDVEKEEEIREAQRQLAATSEATRHEDASAQEEEEDSLAGTGGAAAKCRGFGVSGVVGAEEEAGEAGAHVREGGAEGRADSKSGDAAREVVEGELRGVGQRASASHAADSFSWPPSRGREPSVRPPAIVAPPVAPGAAGGHAAASGGTDGGGVSGTETVVISAFEYQRLKALATPAAASVRVVGDKAVMLASEYSRLSVAASMMESRTTPASTKESGISLAQCASTAGEHPRALRVDSGPGGMEIVTSMTVSPATHTSGANRSSDDMLNLSSDHSSPFSNLSKESPAFTSFAYRDFDLGLSGGELDDTGHKEMDGAKTRTASTNSPSPSLLHWSNEDKKVAISPRKVGGSPRKIPPRLAPATDTGEHRPVLPVLAEHQVDEEAETQSQSGAWGGELGDHVQSLDTASWPESMKEQVFAEESEVGSLDWFLTRRGFDADSGSSFQDDQMRDSRLGASYASLPAQLPSHGASRLRVSKGDVNVKAEQTAPAACKVSTGGGGEEDNGCRASLAGQNGDNFSEISSRKCAEDGDHSCAEVSLPWQISPVGSPVGRKTGQSVLTPGDVSLKESMSGSAQSLWRTGGSSGDSQRWVPVKLRWTSEDSSEGTSDLSGTPSRNELTQTCSEQSMDSLKHPTSQDSSASFASLDLESELEQLKNDDKILEDVRNELHAAIDKSLDSVERLACSEQVPEEEDCFKRVGSSSSGFQISQHGNESSAEQGASASADKTRCRRERNAREMSALGAGWLEKVLNAAESEEENLKGRQDSASEGRVDGKSTNAQHTDHITACGEGVTTCIDGTLPLLPLDHPAEVAGKQSMAKLSFRSTHDLDAGPNTPRTPRVDLLTPRSAPSLSAAASVIMHPQMLVSEPPSQSELPLAGSRSVREERDQKDQNKGDRGGKNVPGKPDTCANPEGSAKLQQGGSRLDPQQDDSAPGSSQEAHAFRKEGGASGQTGPHEGGEVRVGSDSPLIGSEPILGPLLVLPSPRTRQGESASKAKSPSLKETEGIGAPPPPPPLPAQGLGEAPPKSLAPLPPPPPPKDGPGCQQGGLKVVKSMDLIRKYHEFTKVKEKGFGQGANVSSPGASGKTHKKGMGDASAVKAELEGRSAYMKQVLADRERYQEMIEDLAQQLHAFKPTSPRHIDIVVAEMERRLSLLSDERAVLKSFPHWPEAKVEALRDVACRKKELEDAIAALDVSQWSEGASVHDDLTRTMDMHAKSQPLAEWFERNEDDLKKRWQAHGLSLDFSLVQKIKLGSIALAKHAMRLALTPSERYLAKKSELLKVSEDRARAREQQRRMVEERRKEQEETCKLQMLKAERSGAGSDDPAGTEGKIRSGPRDEEIARADGDDKNEWARGGEEDLALERVRDREKAALAAARAKVMWGLESAICFVFRCHQFAGGLDGEALQLFDQLHHAHGQLVEEDVSVGPEAGASTSCGSQV